MEETTELGKREYERAKALLTGYLNERMRVTISDGRVIDGRLICTDRDCNLVLSNCEEFLSQEEMSKDKLVMAVLVLNKIDYSIQIILFYFIVSILILSLLLF